MFKHSFRVIAITAVFLSTSAMGQSAEQRAAAETARASSLLPHEAATLVTAQLLGQRLPDALASELARFFRDHGTAEEDTSPEMDQFGEDLTRFVIGTLASGGPLPVNPADLGLPAVPGLPGDGGLPDLNSLYSTYGLANTLVYLSAAVAVPDLGPWVLPHNVRVVADYVATKTENRTIGTPFLPFITAGIRVGDNFTFSSTTDVDTLIATALDQHTVNDLLVFQVPLSFTINITTTCTARNNFLNRCTAVSVTTQTQTNDRVIATNPSYTFAYPLNAGTFATRVEATDLFQVVYDALGTLNTQKAREATAESPFAAIPGLGFLAPGTGLADLATQAPPVNFYGAQMSENTLANALASGVVNPLLTAITDEGLDVRTVPPAPSGNGLLPLTLNAVINGVTLIDSDQPLDPRFGVTAGYRAEEVRAGAINILVLRWHNVGTQTVGTLLDDLLESLTLGSLLPSLAESLPSAQASIYYDVPQGEYTIRDSRVDGRDAVFVSNFDFAGDPPNLTVPPNLPSAEDLQALAEQLQALLGGDLTPELPGVPE